MSEHQHHGSWAVWLNDTDREPEGWTHLDVRPSNGAHVSEQDAEWLRGVIRAATQRRSRETFTPSFGMLRRLVEKEGER